MSYRTGGSSGVGMDHRQIFAVLEEYFALDDAEIARKEAEAKAKAEQERKANAAKRAAKTKAEKKSSAKDTDNAKKKAPKCTKAKKEKKDKESRQKAAIMNSLIGRIYRFFTRNHLQHYELSNGLVAIVPQSKEMNVQFQRRNPRKR